MEIFNSRELAVGTWLVIFLSYAIYSSSDVKVSIRECLDSIINKTILGNLLIFILNTALLVYLLDLCGYWSAGQFKNLFLWFFASGLVVWFGTSKHAKDGKHFIAVIKGQFSVILFIEFLVAFNTYPYVVELFFVFLPVFFALVKNAESISELQLSICRQIIAVGYGFILYDSVQSIYFDGSSFWTYSVLQDFLTPILLTLLSMPYFIAFATYMRLETSMVKINIYTKDKKLRRYARYLAIKEFGFDCKSIKAWLAYSCIPEFKSKQTISAGLKAFKSSDRYEL